METEKKLQVKKEWKTPELIVLVRNKPEEAVLSACKGPPIPYGSQTDYYAGCHWRNPQCIGCVSPSVS